MYAVTFNNGTICMVDRIVAVMSPHDDEGKKTYYVAQIQGAKRRINPSDVATVAPVAQ